MAALALLRAVEVFDKTKPHAPIYELLLASFVRSRSSSLKAKTALPTFCFTVVENVTAEEQKRFGVNLNELAAAPDMTDEQRSIILGVYLMRIVGSLVLARAISALAVTIRRGAAEATAPPSGRPAGATTP